MRRGTHGRLAGSLGVATGVSDVIGSYPWLIGPVLAAVSQALFAAWFLVVGASLYRMPRVSPNATPMTSGG